MWSYGIYNTVTGQPLLEVEPSSASWTTRLSGGEGDGSFSFNLADMGIPRDTIREMLLPSARMIVVRWGTSVAYAGTPQPRPYRRTGETVTVQTVEVRRIFRWRLLHNVRRVLTDGNLSVSNRSPGAVIRALMLRTQVDGANWVLPLDLPADASGSFTADWVGSDLNTINDLIGQVEKAGNDVLYRPYLDSNGWLRWEVLVGSPLTLAATDISVTAPESPVTDLVVTEDGSEQITGVFMAGNGWGDQLLHTTADLIRFPGGINNIPIRDAYFQAKDVKNADQLQAVADARFNEFNPLVAQWSFALNVGDDLSPMVAAPGRVLKMDTRGDLWIPDGVTTCRVVALSGDGSSKVQVETR